MLELLMLIPLVALLLVSGLCSATETVLFGLTHADRAELARRHPIAARAAARVMAEPRGALITILVVNTASNVAFFVLSSAMATRTDSGLMAVAYGALTVFGALMVGEVLPKLLGSGHRVLFAAILGPLLLMASRVIGPLRTVLDRGVVGPLARLIVPRESPPGLRPEELAALLDAAGREGLIGREDHRLLADVVALNQLRVRDVMTPRSDMAWLSVGEGVRGLAELARRVRRSAVPICEGTIDNGVVGMVSVRGALGARAIDPRRPVDLRDFATPALYVPDRSRLDQLLVFFREHRTDVAICVDEAGVITGTVGIDDVVRALGLATHEPGDDEAAAIERVGPNQWRVSGRLPVHDWAELVQGGREAVELDRRASTVAGLVIAKLGRLPQEGDEAVIGPLSLRVEAMAGRSVERVLVTLREPGAGGVER